MKAGDKVKLVKGGDIGWEQDETIPQENIPWWQDAGMTVGSVYTIESTDLASPNPCIRLVGFFYNHHPDHFELIPMKYTFEEGKFAKEAYESRINVVNKRIAETDESISRLEDYRAELEAEYDNLISEHNKIVENTAPEVDLNKSFVQLVELWQAQPESNKDRFFDEVFFQKFFL